MPRTPPEGVKVRLWDGPVRIVHWLLVALIGFSWWASEDHLDWHQWSGYGVVGLLLFRTYWGFAGGEAARFASFVRGPRATLAYLNRFLLDATRVTRANEATRADLEAQVHQEHSAIVSAIEAGDVAAARQAGTNHMLNAARRIGQADPAFWAQHGQQLADHLRAELGLQQMTSGTARRR